MLRPIAVSLSVAALLLAAEAAAQPPVSRWSGPWDLMAFEVKSWGRPVTSWRLLADGSGRWFAAGEHGYRQVEAILSRLPEPIPDYDGCSNRMTDLPYGRGHCGRHVGTRGPGTPDGGARNRLADTLMGAFRLAQAVASSRQ
jgi:hypothetical protein